MFHGNESCPGEGHLYPGERRKRAFPRKGDIEPTQQLVSSEGPPFEAPLVGSSPLQRGHTRLEVTPSIRRSGAAARSFAECTVSRGSDSAHITAVANDSTISELRQLGLYTKASLPGIVHQIYEQEFAVEFAHAATTTLNRSA